jgi:hypothetical protein
MAMGGMKVRDIAKSYIPSVKEISALAGRVEPQAGQSAQAVDNLVAQLRNKPLTSNITTGEAFEAARKYNLFGSSEAAIELERAVGKAKGKLGQATDTIRYETSRLIEDPAKWALFKDQLLKGKTPEQAAIHVKNFLFDYSELTDFEKGLREFGAAPFYSWMRKNLPLQAQAPFKAPQTFRRIQTVYDAPNRFNPGEEAEVTPLWMREEGYVPNPLMDKGEDGSTPLVRLANPALDLNKLISPRALATNLMGPVPKAITETLAGTDLRTGRKIFGNPDGYTTASPIGAAMETARIMGLPLGTSFGTEASMEKGGFIQGEKMAYAMRQIPLPWLPYVQNIAGSPDETIGTKLDTPFGRRLTDVLLRSLGLTPRDLTPEQQMKVMRQFMEEFKKEKAQMMIQGMGEAVRS